MHIAPGVQDRWKNIPEDKRVYVLLSLTKAERAEVLLALTLEDRTKALKAMEDHLRQQRTFAKKKRSTALSFTPSRSRPQRQGIQVALAKVLRGLPLEDRTRILRATRQKDPSLVLKTAHRMYKRKILISVHTEGRRKVLRTLSPKDRAIVLRPLRSKERGKVERQREDEKNEGSEALLPQTDN